MWVVSFFRLTSDVRESGNPLKISEKDTKFLQGPLLDSCSFEQFDVEDPTKRLWVLRFFQDATWAQRFAVVIEEGVTGSEVSDRDAAKAKTDDAKSLVMRRLNLRGGQVRNVSVATFGTTSEDTNGEASTAASLILRGSYSASEVAYEPLTTDLWLFVDGQGLALLARYEVASTTFERILILNALSIAYRESMETAVNHLAQSDGDLDGLSDLYRKAVTFNARYFFGHPVNATGVALPDAWRLIEARYQLRSRNDEFLQQLDGAQRLLQAERDRQEHLSEKRRIEWERRKADDEQKLMRRVSILGTFIAAFSLLGLMQITPDQAMDFLLGWWNTLR